MAVGSGLGASLGFAPETTYGTYVAPSRWHQVNKAELKKVKNVVQGGGLAAGQLVQRGAQRVVPTEGGTGSFELEVSRTKMGVLLQHLMGSSAAPAQQAATAAYLQTHVLGDTVGKYLTAQVGIPDRAGTVRPMTGKGGKIVSAEFSSTMDSLLTMALEMDFQKLSEVETLATPSYVEAIPFHFGQKTVKVGASYGAEVSVSGVRNASVKIDRNLDTEGYYAGAAGLKGEPIANDWVGVSGSLEVDFMNKTDFLDRFHADTGFSMVVEWVGPIIASTYAYTLRFKLPQVFLNGDTPSVDGPDVVKGTFPWVAQYDGTNPVVTVEYMSTDTTV